MSSLYLKHFDLEKSPFQITPDIDFFFSGSQRGGILTALLHVACHDEGIVTVVAEVGSGKTLLARLMLARLPADISTVYLANPCFSRDEIISAISRDLGLPAQSGTTEENLAQLHQELLRRHAQGQRVLLVIDEAHAMPIESLEEVRLLSNLETDRHKLVNIMLFGQPELDTVLADRRLRQVRDRVIHRFELPPLVNDEATAYIDHRLRVAGWSGGRLIVPAAIAALIKLSQGRARRINLLADKALLAAYAEGVKQVEKRHVVSASGELHPDSAPTSFFARPAFRYGVISVILALLMASAMVGVLGWYRTPMQAQAAPMAPVTPQVAAPVAAAVPVALIESPAPAAKPVIESPAVPAATIQETAQEAVKPSRVKVADVVKRTDELMGATERRGFTLQLASLPSMENVGDYLTHMAAFVDPASLYAHKRSYKGADSAAVYLGYYASEPEARNALNKLPEALKSNHPVIRTWAGIRREPTP
jgi:type II secretory pathway predicted ATPase ExeA